MEPMERGIDSGAPGIGCSGRKKLKNMTLESNCSTDLCRHQQGKGYIQILGDGRTLDPRPVQPDTTGGYLHIGPPVVFVIHHHDDIG